MTVRSDSSAAAFLIFSNSSSAVFLANAAGLAVPLLVLAIDDELELADCCALSFTWRPACAAARAPTRPSWLIDISLVRLLLSPHTTLWFCFGCSTWRWERGAAIFVLYRERETKASRQSVGRR